MGMQPLETLVLSVDRCPVVATPLYPATLHDGDVWGKETTPPPTTPPSALVALTALTAASVVDLHSPKAQGDVVRLSASSNEPRFITSRASVASPGTSPMHASRY